MTSFRSLSRGFPLISSNLPAILVEYVADQIDYAKYDVLSTNNVHHVRLCRWSTQARNCFGSRAGHVCSRAQVSRLWLSFRHSSAGAQTSRTFLLADGVAAKVTDTR